MFLLNSEWYRNNSEILQCQHCLLSARVLSVTSPGSSNARVRSKRKKIPHPEILKEVVSVHEFKGSAVRELPRTVAGSLSTRAQQPGGFVGRCWFTVLIPELAFGCG